MEAKVLPDNDVLKKKADEVIDKKISEEDIELWDYSLVKEVEDLFKSFIDEDKAIKEIKDELSPDIDKLRDDVEDKLSNNPTENWAHYTEEHITNKLEEEDTSKSIKQIVERNTNTAKLSILKRKIEEMKKEISKITKNGGHSIAC